VGRLDTLSIIVEECQNNKINLLCCFVGFRNICNTMSSTKISNRLEEINFPFELTTLATRLYDNTFSRFRINTKDQLEEIDYNIGVKKGCLIFPSLFGIHIDKLKGCLEEPGCFILTLVDITIFLLHYSNFIFLMVRSPYNLKKKLKILKDLCSSMFMIVKTEKTKVMVIK
jgi:hypothetical protein